METVKMADAIRAAIKEMGINLSLDDAAFFILTRFPHLQAKLSGAARKSFAAQLSAAKKRWREDDLWAQDLKAQDHVMSFFEETDTDIADIIRDLQTSWGKLKEVFGKLKEVFGPDIAQSIVEKILEPNS